MRYLRIVVTLAVISLLSPISGYARDLGFEERVQAQEAIERVYYSHQIGTTHRFEETVPRELLEGKVQKYLKQSAALEQYWGTPVTAEMLRAEMNRIVRDTKMPSRLMEIYSALGNDPFLVEECLARPSLVDRLSRNFFLTDESIHGETRRQAQAVHARLVSGVLNVRSEEPHRHVENLILGVGNSESHVLSPSQRDTTHREGTLELDESDFEKVRKSVGMAIGEVGPVVDESDAFRIKVILGSQANGFKIVTYTFPKKSWESWWASHQDGFDEQAVLRVALSDGVLPYATQQPTPEPDCIPADTWKNESLDSLPSMRVGPKAVWTGTLMILWGGEDIYTGHDPITGGRYDPVTDTWQPMTTSNAPDGRYGHSAVWTGSRMIIWGGDADRYRDYGTGGIYDPIQDKWESTSTLNAPTSRLNHAAVWTGQLMLVWGGRGWNGFPSQGGRFDPATNIWTPISETNAPSPRESLASVWTGDLMLIWGGYRGTYPHPNDGGRYDPKTDTWSTMSIEGAPQPRSALTSVWTGSQMMVWGGEYLDFYYHWWALNSGGRYDPAQDKWLPISMVGAPSPRRDHAAVWTGTEMLVWGGNPNIPGTGFIPNLGDGARYNPLTDQWQAMSSFNAPAGRAFHAAVWTGELMIVWGGMIGKVGPMTNTGGRYDPQTNSWTPTSPTNVPLPRKSHTAIWTGSQMIVWGGHYSSNTRPPGGKYDPLLDTWSTVSEMNAPEGWEDHSAVWTGDRMIIWGGLTDYGKLAGGGASYDPVVDTWARISAINAPAPRTEHTAVWTGSQMVVWGGIAAPYYNFYGSGGRYDPATDTWMPTSIQGSPSARSLHTAVWTGSRMLIWGGYNQTEGEPETGAQYDPVSDTWTPMSTTNVPSPRYWHTAVWTGSRMIVWGGQSYQSRLREGGTYDPLSDTWGRTSTLNAPEGRVGHSATWTGKEMIIWGGSLVDLGAGYDPLADRWRALSDSEAPSPRHHHTAVWTGDSLIVWGGEDSPFGPLHDDGGRYYPDFFGQSISVHAGEDQIIECSGSRGTPVVLAGAAIACDPSATLSYTWRGPFPEGGGVIQGASPQVTLPLGNSTLTLRVEDGDGGSADDEVVVTVRDTTAPQITIGASPSTLWPPNHRMVDVAVPVLAADACGTPTVVLDSITSSELDDAAGSSDGNTAPDIQAASLGTADFTFQLRAERDGAGDGRTYRVTYEAIDTTGNRSIASSLVLVPHDQGGVAEPLLITAQDATGNTILSWNAVPHADSYQMLRGELGGLRETGSFIDLGSVSCIYPNGNLLVAERTDAEIPPVGSGYFYLVSYVQGTDSGYGTDTANKPRLGTDGGCDQTGVATESGPAAESAWIMGERKKSTTSP